MSDNFSDFDNLIDLFTTVGSKLLEKAHIYVGTRDAWDQLTVAEKTAYQFTAFLGDTESGIVDDVPTENSENLVKSGGVYSQVQTLTPTILTQTLTAGATSLTFTNIAIGNNSRIRPFSNPFVMGLIEDATQSGTSVTLTCAEQSSDVSVSIEVYNYS